ncbi:MAG TPA: porin, partial [Schlesneria sp.]
MVSTRKSSWGRIVTGLALAGRLAALVGGLGIASALAAEDPFEDLRSRIEQLEKDNENLRTAMVPQASAGLGSVGAVPPAPDELEPPTEEEQRIRNIVERYLQRHPDVSDVTQDQSISSIQGNIAKILEKMDKKTLPSVQIHGAFQADAGVFSQDTNSKISYGDIQNGADFRRARISASGSMTERTNYVIQVDFAFFGRPTFTDVWVEQTQIPILGNWRIGQWKQPFSLEVVSS